MTFMDESNFNFFPLPLSLQLFFSNCRISSASIIKTLFFSNFPSVFCLLLAFLVNGTSRTLISTRDLLEDFKFEFKFKLVLTWLVYSQPMSSVCVADRTKWMDGIIINNSCKVDLSCDSLYSSSIDCLALL